jgi:flagellar M-ring protein FliF
MFNFIKEFSAQFQNFLRSLSIGKRISLLILTGGTIAGFIVMILWTQSFDYQLLYANLTQDDAASIVMKLKDQKVPYKISGDGNSIMIPKDKVYEIRLQLASEGLPQGGGAGYELFDKNNFGMTEFVQKLNYQRALQGELSRTINQLSEIDKSRVHLVIPEESLFVEDQKEATASVFLKLHPGRELKKDQIAGIVHLVASSVIGLKSQNVTLVDQNGNILSGGEEKNYISRMSNSQLEYQDNLERRLESRIQTLLERVVGKGGVIARVSASLDFRQFETTEEKYDPESQVVRSQNSVQEKSQGKGLMPTGQPGVASNIPGANEQPKMGNSSEFQKTNETVNYEINKITQRTVAPVGKIKRLTVAVMVDGKKQEGKGGEKYIPRTPQEMKKYENIVKNAIGFSQERNDRVTVENIPFEKIGIGEEELKLMDKAEKQRFIMTVVKYAVSGILILFGFLFILRPIIRGLTEGIRREHVPALPRTVGELEAEMQSEEEMEDAREEKKKAVPREKMIGLVKENPAYTAELVRAWLGEGGKK